MEHHNSAWRLETGVCEREGVARKSRILGAMLKGCHGNMCWQDQRGGGIVVG